MNPEDKLIAGVRFTDVWLSDDGPTETVEGVGDPRKQGDEVGFGHP